MRYFRYVACITEWISVLPYKRMKFFIYLIELSTSFDNEYTSDGNHDDTFTSNLVMVCPSIDKRFVVAYSCLNIEQIVCRKTK